MFRVDESESSFDNSVAKWVVEIALMVALVASLGAVFLIYQEHRLLDSVPPMSSLEVLALRRDAAIQLVLSSIVSASLIFCIVSLWWLQRRYLASQRSLRQVKMLAHDILASMDRGVVTTSRDGIVTSINSAAIALLRVEESVGRPLDNISTAVPLVGVYREVVDHEATIRDREFSVDRGGRTLRLRVDGHVLKDGRSNSLGCVIHLRDVTEPKLLEDRMRRMESFISLGTLASGLRHEIKNPLTALSIHVQLLEERLANGQTGEPTEELVGVLKHEVNRLNGVVESFGSFANLERLAIRPTDALEVVDDAIRLIRPQAAEQNVEIVVSRPNELPPAPLDPEKFEQALLNLLINALEAMPDGGKLTIGNKLDNDWFRTWVTDTGAGIPSEVQRRLFEPFFSTKSKGSGMGLALSEKLISQHGGQIQFRTGPEGTTFELAVPRAVAATLAHA